MYTEISRCRLSGSRDLVNILSLGVQHLSGVFPPSADSVVPEGPLDLVWCPESGLVQLKQTYPLDQMYGENYGYRSGLNRSMVRHLQEKVARLKDTVRLADGDLVLDIGSNDGTLLGAYQAGGVEKVGVDPSAAKFLQYYDADIEVIVDFFSADLFRARFPNRRAKIVTSVAMFYDLEDPLAFVRDVAEVLADDGVWHFEQSYLPMMLERNAYDTVCHEHLEYYAMRQVKWMADQVGLVIVDVQFNETNGGSFAVTAAKRGGPYEEATRDVESVLASELAQLLDTRTPYNAFRDRVWEHRSKLIEIIDGIRAKGHAVAGLGASTKGNVLLQFCGLDSSVIPYISEVNPDKFGCVTPGSRIPIIPEEEARHRKPDYLLVLPWHFRDNLIAREHDFLSNGGRLIFPLPEIEIVSADGVLR